MDDQYKDLLQRIESDPVLARACYLSNNAYAYYTEINDKKGVAQERKAYNFVPTYDKWCLCCKKKNVSKACSRCKTVYFCDQTCQKAAWPVHSKHCGRNQFAICATCGSGENNVTVKCANCPVVWCSETCQNKIFSQHVDFDCATFAKLFKK